MATVTVDRERGEIVRDHPLSVRRISQVSGIPWEGVKVLVDHFGLPTYRHATLIAVLPEGRARLVEILERHPGVEPGIDGRL